MHTECPSLYPESRSFPTRMRLLLFALVAFAATGTAAQSQTEGQFLDISSGPLGPVLDGAVTELVTAPDGAVYAAGGNSIFLGGGYVARWTSSGWEQIAEHIPGQVRTFAFAPDGDLYVAGNFDEIGGVEVNNIARWNGSSWWRLRGSAPGYIDALAIGPDETIYAGGSFNFDSQAASVAAFRDNAWSPLEGLSGSTDALAVSEGGDLYASGHLRLLSSNTYLNTYRWTGTEWMSVGEGLTSLSSPHVYDLVFAPDG